MTHRLWLLGALGIASVLARATGCSCGDGEERAGAGGSRDAARDESSASGSGGVFDAGKDADSSVVCVGGPKSPIIPSGWKRFPGLPCECDVWLAPDPSLMSPAPGWITTAPGVLEMENNWADYAHRFYGGSALGDSWEGAQYLAYLRDLGNGVQESVIVRLPENQVIFQAKIPGGFNALCRAGIPAMNQGLALYRGSTSTAAPGTPLELLGSAAPPGPLPGLIVATHEPVAPYAFAVGQSIAAWVVSPGRIDAFRIDGSASYSNAWTSSSPLLANNPEILAWDDAVFFDVAYPTFTYQEEVWVWDPQSGPRALIPVTGSEPGKIGSACALGTDGKVMVWSQSSGWNGTQWDSVDLMMAPFTTDPKKLEPTKLRSLTGARSSCVRWKVQAGYASSWEFTGQTLDGGFSFDNYDSVLVRLSDGVMWTIPKRPERYFGRALYITPAEAAFEESFRLPNDAGVTEFESWSIVRYPMSLLGAGTPP